MYALAYSPDGAVLASGRYDETVKLWDSISGKLLHTLPAGYRRPSGLGVAGQPSRDHDTVSVIRNGRNA